MFQLRDFQSETVIVWRETCFAVFAPCAELGSRVESLLHSNAKGFLGPRRLHLLFSSLECKIGAVWHSQLNLPAIM